jgi:hypothetical protein
MIVYYLILIFLYILGLITTPLQLLPIASLSVDLTGTLTSAGNYIALFNLFLPLGTLFTVFGIVIGIEAAYFTYKAVKWVYNKIPGVT